MTGHESWRMAVRIKITPVGRLTGPYRPRHRFRIRKWVPRYVTELITDRILVNIITITIITRITALRIRAVLVRVVSRIWQIIVRRGGRRLRYAFVIDLAVTVIRVAFLAELSAQFVYILFVLYGRTDARLLSVLAHIYVIMGGKLNFRAAVYGRSSAVVFIGGAILQTAILGRRRFL